jgi:urease accessory protein
MVTVMHTAMTTEPETAWPALPILRLMQLVSPSLPVGGFTYSQGIEWAADRGWICNRADLCDWLDDQLNTGLARVDLPILARLMAAAAARDDAALSAWVDTLLAHRETAELRAEESNRGRALADLLVAWGVDGARERRPLLGRCQLGAFAWAASAFGIEPGTAAAGYAWSWVEGLVVAAVKIVPLGQTDGQCALLDLAGRIPAAVHAALALDDEGIGASAPALGIASGLHETQYTRLFRS